MSFAMSPLVTELIRQYRARADEARTMANATKDEDNREKWLQVADTWERMAGFEERKRGQGYQTSQSQTDSLAGPAD